MTSTAVSRVGYELRSYLRAPDAMVFSFMFPIMMLLIFATVFSEIGTGDLQIAMSGAEYYLPAMLASGIFLSGFQNLGIDLAVERHDGTRRRLAATPLPVASYLVGKLGQVLVTSLLQSLVLMIIAVVVFGVNLPTSVQSWVTFSWVYLLGLSGSVVLGFAFSYLPRSAKSAMPVVLPPVLILQFISGVYLPFTSLPGWLQDVSSLFPLKWLAQGMRSVFLPDEFALAESGGEWNLIGVALVLSVWFVSGLIATLLSFRWVPKN